MTIISPQYRFLAEYTEVVISKVLSLEKDKGSWSLCKFLPNTLDSLTETCRVMLWVLSLESKTRSPPSSLLERILELACKMWVKSVVWIQHGAQLPAAKGKERWNYFIAGGMPAVLLRAWKLQTCALNSTGWYFKVSRKC